MRFSRTGLIAFILLSSCIASARQRSLVFTAEIEEVKKPVQLPTDALKLLVSDKQYFSDDALAHLRCSSHEHPTSKPREPEDQILCTKLDLSQPSSGTDYLVIGVGALRGAHIVPLWIIHQERNMFTLIFKTGADALNILPDTYGGYHEIVATFIFGAGATIRDERYRFDGRTYKLFSSHEMHN